MNPVQDVSQRPFLIYKPNEFGPDTRLRTVATVFSYIFHIWEGGVIVLAIEQYIYDINGGPRRYGRSTRFCSTRGAADGFV